MEMLKTIGLAVSIILALAVVVASWYVILALVLVIAVYFAAKGIIGFQKLDDGL